MRVLDEHELPTMEMITDDLTRNPPGQGFMGMHVEFSVNAPFYIVYLMAELERSRQSKRQRKRRPDVRQRFLEEIQAFQQAYFDSDDYKEQARRQAKAAA